MPPDHAGATRVMAGAAIAPRVVEQRVVGFHLTAGQALFADKLLERRCLKHPPGEEQTADDRRPVGFPPTDSAGWFPAYRRDGST